MCVVKVVRQKGTYGEAQGLYSTPLHLARYQAFPLDSVTCCWMNEWIHVSIPLIFLISLLPAQGPYFQKSSSILGHVWLVKRFWDYPFWKWLPSKTLILLSHAALSPANPPEQGNWKADSIVGKHWRVARMGVLFFYRLADSSLFLNTLLLSPPKKAPLSVSN